MEVFAGGVSESDRVFDDLTATIDETLSKRDSPVSLRHQVLQLAVIFVCGVSQLSPGAYFLRRDLFPSIVTTITSPDTEQFTFEAALLLAALANFHKSDAAKLNPYLRCIRETTNKDLMQKICWASNFAADAVVKAYQNVSDDSPPTLSTAFGSLLWSLRPDIALASTPIDPPRELFKTQPIEACVILLLVFEFLHVNHTFRKTLVESIGPDAEKKVTRISPLLYTLLSLSSYLLTHASSTSSPRAIAYANLSLNILLGLVENDAIMRCLCQTKADIRLCRQRLPYLPISSSRAPICALLDCCVLWMRHNLHKRLEVQSYITCIRVCYRAMWYFQREHVRLEYHWQEYWRALVGLLDFLANKLDSLITTGGIEQLVQETLLVLDLALCHADTILPRPKAIHEFVYEVVRSATVLKKQQQLLEKLALPQGSPERRISGQRARISDAMANIFTVSDYYEGKIGEAGVHSAKTALRVVAKEIEKDGLSYGKDLHSAEEPPRQSEDIVGFIRFAYVDGMALMA